MSMFVPLFGDLFAPLFAPLFENDPAWLALMEGGFLTTQDGGKIEIQ
jgi:hypothetical protein